MDFQHTALITISVVFGAVAVYHKIQNSFENKRLKQQTFKKPVKHTPVEIRTKDLPPIDVDEKLLDTSSLIVGQAAFEEYEMLVEQQSKLNTEQLGSEEK